MFGVTAPRRYWAAILPITIALGLMIWQSQFEGGWLEMAVGSGAWLFWASVAIWSVSTAWAIRRSRWGWLILLTAPIVFYPVLLWAFLFVACATGSCL